MSRYLQRYVGQYRVKSEYDLSTNDYVRDEQGNIDQSFDDLYIPCKNGGRINYIGKGILQYYNDNRRKGANIIKEIEKDKELFAQISDIVYTDSETAFSFNARVLEGLEKYISPKTYGASISPFSNKNLPKTPYKIPKNASDKYKTIISSYYADHPFMIAKLTTNFVKGLSVDGQRGDVVKKKMCLGNKEFIHKTGHWDEYLLLLEDEGKDLTK